jgi:hypothetical protein
MIKQDILLQLYESMEQETVRRITHIGRVKDAINFYLATDKINGFPVMKTGHSFVYPKCEITYMPTNLTSDIGNGAGMALIIKF